MKSHERLVRRDSLLAASLERLHLAVKVWRSEIHCSQRVAHAFHLTANVWRSDVRGSERASRAFHGGCDVWASDVLIWRRCFAMLP
jgi:hypothetical protein